MFRSTIDNVRRLIQLKSNPGAIIKAPLRSLVSALSSVHALPRKTAGAPVLACQSNLSDLPQIQSWPGDGGAFITLPQVYTEHPQKKGVLNSNLGMYRIQISGNDYHRNEEAGMHYQLHRGIGIHHTLAVEHGLPLQVCIFVGGPPAHSFAAVMPLPEQIPEGLFAGVLAGRRFRHTEWNGYRISADADFCIVGEIIPDTVKPEGPFGDHLGYYSLKHDFPVMKVNAVFHRRNAIWPFTVVGRPPQEDTTFNLLIQEITGPLIPGEIPGLKE
jgi:4-hydroxy-3-polyprenylbenzoate decarboxylase